MRARYLLAASLVLSLSSAAPPAKDETEDEARQRLTLKSWARKFEVQYCPRACNFHEKEVAAAHAALAASPKADPDSQAILEARVSASQKDLEACQKVAAAGRAVFVQQLDAIDCEHLLALADRPDQCTPDVKAREPACRAQLEEAKRRAEEAKAEQERAEAAAHAALLQDKKLMTVTFSAALCVYGAARESVSSEIAAAKARSTKSGVPEDFDELPRAKRPPHRLNVINNLFMKTKTALTEQWDTPPIPCTDATVSHVAECLTLREFSTLGDEYSGPQPAVQCTEEIVARANQVGTLIPEKPEKPAPEQQQP